MIRLKRSIFVISLTLFLIITGCEKEVQKTVMESPVPDFTLSDLAGKKVSLSDYKGNVVILDFWATWCPPCKDSIPYLETLYKKYKDEGLVIIGISFDRDIEKVKRFKEKYDMTYPNLMGEEWIKDDYGVTGVPEMFIINREGVIISHHRGFHPSLAGIMDKKVKELL